METKEQAKDKETPSDAGVLSESPEEANAVRPSVELPFDLSKIDPKTLARADSLLEGTGFSIQKLADWANDQTLKTALIIENMPSKETVKAGIGEALSEMAKQAAARQQQMIQQGMPQGGSGANLGQIISLLSDSGGGVNEQMVKLQTELMRASIDNMKQGASNSKAITDAVVSRITQKAIGKTLDKITE